MMTGQTAEAVVDWIHQHQSFGEPLRIREWEDETFRKAEGWQGHDLIHHPNAPVQIHNYRVEYGLGIDIGLTRGGAGTRLTGIVEFRAAAESHQGLCHGGSMCAIMDDIVGWIAFCVTGNVVPWSGYTVQVNTSLRQPVQVGSTLQITAVIHKVERRKVYVTASLLDPKKSGGNNVHAVCEGLVILNRGVLSSDG